jgi:hypothetical protein
MSYGFIYKIEFPNGKYYIGLTTTSLKQRTKEHTYSAKKGYTSLLYKALRKHDMIDKFELIEIDRADTLEKLCELEIRYIKEYNSYYMNGKGYNMTCGGEGTIGYIFTENDKQKISESLKKYYEDNPEAIQKNSESRKKYYQDHPELRQKNSEALKKYYQDNPEAIQKNSEALKKYYQDHPEARQKNSESQKKYYDDNPELRQQISESLKKYYEDNPEAIQTNNKAQKKYYENNPELRQKVGERMKKYYENPEARQKISESQKKYYEDNPELRQKVGERMKKYYENPEAIQKMLDKKGKNRPFDIFTSNGTFVNTFTYQFEAIEYLQKHYNITSNIKIYQVLAGNRKTSAGFVFKYK